MIEETSEARERDHARELSWAQQRLWFIDQLEGGSAAYHLPLVIRLQGELNVPALQSALDALVARHDVLRTTFVQRHGEPVQRPNLPEHFALQCVSITDTREDEREQAIMRRAQLELAVPFDLSRGPLIRGSLVRFAEADHALVITMHHIVSDGWSLGVLTRELFSLYRSFREGGSDRLPALPVQYADYAHWQRRERMLEQNAQVAYWQEHLQGAPRLLELPTDRPRPPVQSYKGATLPVVLGPQLSAELRALSRKLNLTPAMVLHTAWTILLARLSGQGDIVVGIPVADRRRTEVEGLVGLFVNTLAIRVRLEDDPSVTELLHRVRRVLLAAYGHQDAPFEKVVEAIQPERSLSHSPVFQVMFVLQNTPQNLQQIPGLTLTELEVPLQTAQFDLLLSLHETADGFGGSLNYASDLFEHSTIERWVRCLKVVLHGLVHSAHASVSRLPLLDITDRRELIEHFNATRVPYARDQLIHRLFEEQAARTPSNIAVVCERQSLTYAQLNARANQLARHLLDRGIGPDQLVGICIERSIEMVVGLLGILKAGGAYVPMDPNYPAERLHYMLEDARPGVLLTQQALLGRLPPTDAEVIVLDRDSEEIARRDGHDLDPAALGLSSTHLAYVIYTSGSTGKPKGAMNEHGALINRLQWMQRAYQLDTTHRVLQKTPFSFDVSVWEFFWTLMTGAQLIVARPNGHQDPDYLRQIIEDAGVTTLHFVPSMLQIFLAQHQRGQCPSLRHVICSGEELTAGLRRRFFECLPDVQLSNLYGPTEAAIDVTFWECNAMESGSRVPIGHPIANTQMYLLDRHMQPVPIGVSAELYIGGVGVGRGYWNRPELTAERFIRDPFSDNPQARLYKTGDLGRWRVDGAIEYLGRNDYQVKLRGQRIELGEIEAQLGAHEAVKEAVVVAREDVPGEHRLVAYLVAASAVAPSADDLRAHLQSVLPEYMVPSAFVMLERFPLTPNGKLDRSALPEPALSAYSSKRYEAPQGEVEEILSGIWQSLLRVERVGRQDNFFELGGHSLLIVQMMERLRRLGFAAQLRGVYESPTLAKLATAIRSNAVERMEVPPQLIPPDCAAITPQMLPLVELSERHIEKIVRAVPGGARNIQDIYPLTPLQEGILFHHLLDAGRGDTYVLPAAFAVSSRARVDQLIAALQAVIDRHDVLRSAVLWEELPRPVQVVCRRAILPVDEVVLDPHRSAQEQVREWIEPQRQRVDLRHAPLARLRLAVDSRTAQWYALLQFHHVVIDHVTLETIVAETVAQLEGAAQQLAPSLPYRNHVAQALAYGRLHDSESFFRRKLGDVDEPTAPFGLLDVHGDGAAVHESRLDLSRDLAQRIRAQARRMGVSAATLFHAAWGLVVARTSGRDDVVFGSVLLGRLLGDAGAQSILGMFINTLPLRLQLAGVGPSELVDRTQRELVELLDHEQASLAMAQRCSAIGGSVPLFTSLLNYRHSVPDPAGQWSRANGIRVLAAQERTNYPIAMSVDDLGVDFSLTALTDRRIDAPRLTAYLCTAMSALVAALEQSSQVPALELDVLPESERLQLLESFNATAAQYPADTLTHELFEEQVARTPDAVAVTYEGQCLTYGELNAAANQLAAYLRVRGVTVGDYVPVLMSRSLQMLIAQLAVMKAGGVYVPTDPELPPARQAFMIIDCGARHVLVDGPDAVDLQGTSVEWIDCRAVAAQVRNQPRPDPGLSCKVARAAYVMYTSGSTGTPKGIVVPHHAINRLVINCDYARIGADDCIAHYSNPAFDASTFEIWGALLNGAKVVIVPQSAVLDAPRFAAVLLRHRVTILYMSVGLFNQYADVLATVFSSLRYLLVGGDTLDPAAIRRVLRNSPPGQLLNAYGPTECTTFSTTHLIETVGERDTSIPIGRPLTNGQIYILDARMRPTPIGVAGEMYIGGEGLARGYLNRPELTAERFLRDPFRAHPRARMYKTGDLARWRADGVIEYLGRNDDQVKIRGFRIELGEIEARLAAHPQLRQAVVVMRTDSHREKRLVAYVVAAEQAAAPTVEALRDHVKNALPEYMVPGAFVLLEQLPLSTSGKVNRSALPAPELNAHVNRLYEAPQGEVEGALASICQDLLNVAQVGRHDDFFALGGHSLLALRLISAARQAIGADLKVADIYRNPTIVALAARVRDGAAAEEFVDLASEASQSPKITAIPQAHSTLLGSVLLTGATGFVGRFLLAQLLRDTNATVYCLVRAQSERQAALRLHGTLQKWDLWRDEFEARIVAVPGNLQLPRLGIEPQTYAGLCRRIDAILHCGTSMNHLETYAMAKAANVDSAGEILRLATHERLKTVHYVSTLGVFNPASGPAVRTVNETTPIEAERHATANGYTASKWVGEKIFLLASEAGVPCNIYRLGLVWADTSGRYDELQREYRMLKTCLLSGCGIKNYLPAMAPTPVDYVARAITFLAQTHSRGRGVFHLASPGSRIGCIFERCNEIAGTALELLPYGEWIARIRRLHQQGWSLPAVPLIEFAFALDGPALAEHERIQRNLRFDCSRTYSHLERGGIFATLLDDELLLRCIEDAISRDEQLREMRDQQSDSTFARVHSVVQVREVGGLVSR